MHLSYRLSSFFIIFAIFLSGAAMAQKPDSAVQPKSIDSQVSGYVKKLQKFGKEETARSIEKYELGRLAIHQTVMLDRIKKTNLRLKGFLKSGIDTLGVAAELNSTASKLAIVEEGIFVNKSAIQSQRNLAVSSAIIKELLNRLSYRKNIIDQYHSSLVSYQYEIDSLSADSALYTFPDDSLALVNYLKRIVVIATEMKPVDSATKQALANVEALQLKVDNMVVKLNATLEDVNLYQRQLSTRMYDEEINDITLPANFLSPFSKVWAFSIAKEKLAIVFYIKDNLTKLAIVALLIIALGIFIRSLKHKSPQEEQPGTDLRGRLVTRYPTLSAIMIILSLFQFIFTDPPFIFSSLLWTITAVCLIVIMHKYISRFWMNFWFVMLALFLLATFDNFILQASKLDRWFMLGLAATGVVFTSFILRSGKTAELRERGIIYFIWFVLILELLAVIANLSGRYNLSKTLLTTGYTGVVIAISFLWTVRLINEALAIASSVYKHPDKKLFYINFERVGERVPLFFYVLLVIGWAVLVGRNFYTFNELVSPFYDFLSRERTLGNYTFSIYSLFIFLVIITCSMLLSRFISFFVSTSNDSHTGNSKPGKVGAGSWILLIRIFIISIGLFLAFAAAGIPLDKITIILGALSVGIGLGLQNLVSNLVSGFIIAFERPLSVGDMIEVNGKMGTMKSIGFRSSTIIMSDGAALIIPNGDLLNQHLVNWSAGKKMRQLSVSVSVAYNSDLSKVKEMLKSIMMSDDRVLKHPAPYVFAKQFSNSAIDFELNFWARQSEYWNELKGDIITEIDKRFKEEGIEIPHHQADLHIRSIAGIEKAIIPDSEKIDLKK
jgi:potassium efflux system protein